jgi:type IV pilus assembly protein PilW
MTRHRLPQRDRSDDAGFTLVEILVALMIGVVIVGAGFAILTSSRLALRSNEQTVDMQQSVRMAMELLSRDMKMAGFGAPGGAIGNCTSAIVPNDQNATGADTGSDSVQLLVPTTKSSGANRWTLRTATSANGTTQIDLQQGGGGAVADMVSAGLAAGSYISIGGAATVQVTSVNAGASSIGISTIPPPLWFQMEDQVYLLQCIRYQVVPQPDAANLCLGGAPCLTRGVVGGTGPNAETPIAQGVEDLQLAYACDGCVATINGGIPDRIIDDQNGSNSFDQGDFLSDKTWATAPLTPDKIQLVQIALVVRQLKDDMGFAETGKVPVGSSQTVLTADRTLPADQNNRRRILTKTVETRNVGL